MAYAIFFAIFIAVIAALNSYFAAPNQTDEVRIPVDVSLIRQKNR